MHPFYPCPILLLTNSDGKFPVPVPDIIACCSCNSYTEVLLTDGRKIVVSQNLSYYEKMLQPHHFVRIHARHLVQLLHIKQIKKVEGGYVALLFNQVSLPVSRQQKPVLLHALRTLCVPEADAKDMQLPINEPNAPNSNKSLPN